MVPEAIAQTAALAKYPNVSVKLSSVPLISTEPYPFRDAIPHIHRLFDAYGPQRCHWGTDVTNSFASATYRQRVTQFTEELDFPLGRGQGLDHGPRDPGTAKVGLGAPRRRVQERGVYVVQCRHGGSKPFAIKACLMGPSLETRFSAFAASMYLLPELIPAMYTE